MPGLIDELRAEHTDIMGMLLRVKALGVRSDDGQRVLLGAKDRLLAHLSREDEHLYPALKRAAEKDATLREQLDLLAMDMEAVSALASKFFEKYSGGFPMKDKPGPASFFERLKALLMPRGRDSVEDEFSRDFEDLYRTVLDRIRKEESTIYAAFAKIAP